MHKYHISSRTRILGWAWWCKGIPKPTTPKYTGTLRSILMAQAHDDEFMEISQSLDLCSQWFYSSEPIVKVADGWLNRATLGDIDSYIRLMGQGGFDVYTTAPVAIAGRPKIDAKKQKKKISLTLDAEVVEHIRHQKNSSAYVNQILKNNIEESQ